MKFACFSLILVMFLFAGCSQSGPAVKTTDNTTASAGSAAPAPASAAPASAAVASTAPAPKTTENGIPIETNPGPGPYVGETNGYPEDRGTVTVTLQVANNVLTSVKVEGPRETPGVGSRAIDTMGAAMLKANSIKVDVVSGATHTSESVLYAAEMALAKAGLTDADLKR